MMKIKLWKEKMELKGLRMNTGKTKVMCCRVRSGQVENSGKWPCGVCRKGVGVNSIFCIGCKQWVHKRCSGLTGSLNAVVGFKCRRCVEGTGYEEVEREIEIEHVGKLECVDKFCYLGDMIGAGGGLVELRKHRQLECGGPGASSENYRQY